MLLAGDIGGTKTKLAVFSAETGPRVPLAEATFASADYPSLEVLVRQFMSQVNFPIEKASFGVAGPVVAGHATITNLPWIMDEQQLQKELNVGSVHLLNDLDAIAHGIAILKPDELYTLHAGQPVAKGNIAIIAPGTGLGEAFLTWDGSRYRPHTSEGGHSSFAPANELEIDLLRYLRTRLPHVSYERVCSGKGIPNIYNFLKASGYAPEPSWLRERLAKADDITPVIVETALEGTSELTNATLNMFISILGSEAGNLALKVMSTAGVYLGGGIPPRILSFLQMHSERFLQAFRSKGRLVKLLDQVPVQVILNPSIALFGAAAHGMEK
jgi:glucokinase